MRSARQSAELASELERSDLLNQEELRALVQPNYFIPLAYLVFDWCAIIAAASAAIHWPILYFFAAFIIGGRQHALFVMVHEGVHKHLARRKSLNDFIANWFAGFPVLLDLNIYRRNHLKHHEHLNTDDDPDWVRKKNRTEWHFPKAPKAVALYLPYFVFLWGPVEWSMIVVLFSGLSAKSTYTQPIERRRLLEKLVFYGAAATLITLGGLWKVTFLYWLVPLFFVFPLAQRIRSVAEHFALSWQSPFTSSRDVVAGKLERSLLCPHFVNFHLSHHFYPAVPCYRLHKLHEKLMTKAKFSSAAHVNRGYVELGSTSVLRDVTGSRA